MNRLWPLAVVLPILIVPAGCCSTARPDWTHPGGAVGERIVREGILK